MKRKLLLLLFLGCAVLAGTLFWAHRDSTPLPAGARANRIVVEKSARRLTLFQGTTPLKTYRVALGRAPVGPKEREGDKRTPEGIYVINLRNDRSSYHRSLGISYPSRSDSARAAKQGVPPGKEIMIHGIKNGLGWLGGLHRTIDWTAGCIAVTDAEIDEIYRATRIGTPIEIRP